MKERHVYCVEVCVGLVWTSFRSNSGNFPVVLFHLTKLQVKMSLMAKLFGGGKKNKAPTPQEGIQRLREVEEMLMKKSDFLEKKIETELATAKKYGTKNKRGKCTFVPCNILNNRPPYCVCVGLHYVNVTTTPPAAPVLVP